MPIIFFRRSSPIIPCPLIRTMSGLSQWKAMRASRSTCSFPLRISVSRLPHDKAELQL